MAVLVLAPGEAPDLRIAESNDVQGALLGPTAFSHHALARDAAVGHLMVVGFDEVQRPTQARAQWNRDASVSDHAVVSGDKVSAWLALYGRDLGKIGLLMANDGA